MIRIFTILFLTVFTLWGTAQKKTNAEPMPQSHPAVVSTVAQSGIFDQVQVIFDRNKSRVLVQSPQKIEGVSITIKDRGDQLVVQQNNMTLEKNHTITFPKQAGNSRYTVILQKGNQLLVRRF